LLISSILYTFAITKCNFNNNFMAITKKSLEWLQPIQFSDKDAEKFIKSVEKPVSQANLRKQERLFKVARNLLNRD